MREIQWGSYHLVEDEKEETERFKLLLETLTALINPEAYKKFKNKETQIDQHINEDFYNILQKETGMTESEAKKFMEGKDSINSNDSSLDVVLDPFVI